MTQHINVKSPSLPQNTTYEIIPLEQFKEELRDTSEEQKLKLQDSLLFELITLCQPSQEKKVQPETLCDYFSSLNKIVELNKKMQMFIGYRKGIFFKLCYQQGYQIEMETKKENVEGNFNRTYDFISVKFNQLEKIPSGDPIPEQTVLEIEKKLGNITDFAQKIKLDLSDPSILSTLPESLQNPMRRIIKASQRLENLKKEHPLSKEASIKAAPLKSKVTQYSEPRGGGINRQERLRKMQLQRYIQSMSLFIEKMKEMPAAERIRKFNEFAEQDDRDIIKKAIWEKMGAPDTGGSDFGGEQIRDNIQDPRVYQTLKRGIFLIQVRELLSQIQELGVQDFNNHELLEVKFVAAKGEAICMFKKFSNELQEQLKWGFWFKEGMPLKDDDFGKHFYEQHILQQTVKDVLTAYIENSGFIIDPAIIDELKNVLYFSNDQKKFRNSVDSLSLEAKSLLKKGIEKESPGFIVDDNLFLVSHFQLIPLIYRFIGAFESHYPSSSHSGKGVYI